MLEEWLARLGDRLSRSADVLDSDKADRMQRHNYAMMAKHYVQVMKYCTGIKIV